jgi:hypothetical protein
MCQYGLAIISGGRFDRMPYKQRENYNFSDKTDTFQLNVYDAYRLIDEYVR